LNKALNLSKNQPIDLSKKIPFEPISVKLDGDQFQPDFTAINPLQRVPVVVDDGFRVVESLAILDYLEAKYPSPSLMPKDLQAYATVRMQARESWQQTTVLPEEIKAALPNVRKILEKR
jgi:glutathione S-transferase